MSNASESIDVAGKTDFEAIAEPNVDVRLRYAARRAFGIFEFL